MDNQKLQVPTIINFMYNPNEEVLLFSLQNHPILSIGNLLGITADIGLGKSQLCEILAAYFINPSIATNNIKVHNSQNLCLYVDTERTPNDCYNGLLRISKHCGISHQDIEAKLTYISIINISSAQQKIQEIENIIYTKKNIQLLIIDGILDLIDNPNDLTQSTLLGQKLVSIANINKLAIIYALHGNRNDSSGKGKGHIGDVLQRKSESFLKLKYNKTKNTRIFTSDFSNGKVRNGYNKLSTEFVFNNQLKILNECSQSSITNNESPFKEIFQNTTEFQHKDLIEQYIKITKYSKPTAVRAIKKALETGEITKKYNTYHLS